MESILDTVTEGKDVEQIGHGPQGKTYYFILLNE